MDCSPGFLWTYVRLVIPLVVEVDQLTWLPGAIGLDLVRVYLFGNRTTHIPASRVSQPVYFGGVSVPDTQIQFKS